MPGLTDRACACGWGWLSVLMREAGVSSVICKQWGWGTCWQGVPRQGVMPAFLSSKNQDWNFPDAHFLSFNPHPRTTAAKSVSEGQMLGVGEEQSPPAGPPGPGHLSTQNSSSNTEDICTFPLGPPPSPATPKEGIRGKESCL